MAPERATTARPVDLDAVAAPVDGESPDAPYNPDVWELRARIDRLVGELRTAYEALEVIAERRFPDATYQLTTDPKVNLDRMYDRENYLVEVALHACRGGRP